MYGKVSNNVNGEYVNKFTSIHGPPPLGLGVDGNAMWVLLLPFSCFIKTTDSNEN